MMDNCIIIREIKNFLFQACVRAGLAALTSF